MCKEKCLQFDTIIFAFTKRVRDLIWRKQISFCLTRGILIRPQNQRFKLKKGGRSELGGKYDKGICLSFIAIGWAVLTLSWGQSKICSALVAWWLKRGHWNGYQNVSHTHRLTMCGLKKIAAGVFLESWIELAERWRRRRWRRKQAKNNNSHGYPGWLNYGNPTL